MRLNDIHINLGFTETGLKKKTYLYPEKIVESEAKVYLSNFCNNNNLEAK